MYSRYIQHAHFIPIVGVRKRGAYELFHGDLPRQHSFGTTLRFTGLVPADSRLPGADTVAFFLYKHFVQIFRAGRLPQVGSAHPERA